MATASLAVQLLTVSIISLQRQLYHDRGLRLGTTGVWWNSSYDFVIVGGGSAGCVIAGRLSENPAVSVLLIEAGGAVDVMSDITPSHFAATNTWGYSTIPQQNAALLRANRVIGYARGRVLGGSSTINDLGFSRGNRRGFDSWSTEYGISNWTYDALLPYFVRSENDTDPAVVAANPGYHGTRGPLQVSSCPNPDPIYYRWMDAVGRLGWPTNVDFNGPNQFGATFPQVSQSNFNWTRQSTYSAYIEPIITERPNLHVLIRSLVTSIQFQNSGISSTPTATGVQFTRYGQNYQVQARREVIISGGTVNSPQILMLSGIGPQDHLQSVGVPVRVPSPGVGTNFVDHPSAGFDFLVRNRSDITWDSNQYYSLTTQNLYDFYINHWGPLIRFPTLQTYVGTGINGDTNWPDGNVYTLVNLVNPNITAVSSGLIGNHEEWLRYYRPLAGNTSHVLLNVNIFRPRSRGTIRLRSSSPTDAPLIDPAVFSDPRDLAAIVRAAQIFLSVVESPYMSPYLQYAPVPVPGCPFCGNGTPLSQCTGYLTCVAQGLTVTTGHPVGTCQMGNATNPNAVVDSRLRVYGVQQLRVVDGSVMPNVPNANTLAAIVAIAERAVDFIKEDNMIP